MRVYVESTTEEIFDKNHWRELKTGGSYYLKAAAESAYIEIDEDQGRPPELPFDPKKEDLKVVGATIVKRMMPSPVLHAGRYKRGRATGEVEFEPPQVVGQSPRAIINIKASTVKTAWQLCQDILDGTIHPEVDRGNVHGRIRPVPEPESAELADWPLTSEVLKRHMGSPEPLRLRLAKGSLEGDASLAIRSAKVFDGGIEYLVDVTWFRENGGRVDRMPEGVYKIVYIKEEGVRLRLINARRSEFQILGPAAK